LEVPRKSVFAAVAQWFTGDAEHPRSQRERLTRMGIVLSLLLLIALLFSSVAANIQGRIARNLGSLATATAITATSADAQPTQTANGATPSPSSASGKLIFSDEFNGASLDTDKWIALNRPGDASNNEEECYRTNNVKETAGTLVLTSLLDSACSSFLYTSGAVQTRSFHFLYGTIAIRAKMPHGQGMWPALWLLGANCQSLYPSTPDNGGACQWPIPGSDEVDILEMKGQDPSTDYMSINYGSQPNQAQNVQCAYSGPDFSQEFHTFSLIWTPGQIIWYVDGTQRCSQTTGVPSHPLFLIMNSAIGGNFVGSVDSSIFPQTHVIDYVRIYQ
jgi:beta-glucanase (GH16 family)